jgi:hypothetical protein
MRAVKDAERGPPSEPVSFGRAPLAAPLFLSATVIPGAVRLLFQNQSRFAPEIAIDRDAAVDWQPRGTPVARGAAPPTGATVYFDDRGVAPGAYRYRMWALDVTDPAYALFSPEVAQWAVFPPSASSGVTAHLMTVAKGWFATRAPSGDFAVLSIMTVSTEDGLRQVNAVLPPGDLGFDALRLPSRERALHFITDRQGHPHSVYFDAPENPDGRTAHPIIHAWHDGHRWQREEIARRPMAHAGSNSLATVAAAFGPDGTLHAAWFGRREVSLLEIAAREEGTWILEDVAAAFGSAFLLDWLASLLIACDEAGAVHLFVGSTPVHLFQDAGTWRAEYVPVGGNFFEPLGAFGGNASLVLIGTSLDPLVGGNRRITLSERTTAGWASPEIVAPAANQSVQAVQSWDRRRIAIVTNTGRLFLREPDGTVEHTWPKSVWTPFAVGFNSDNKAWVLDWLALDSYEFEERPVAPGTVEPAALYEEL